MSNPIDNILSRVSRNTYVILVQPPTGRLTVFLEPGTGSVWKGTGVFGQKRGNDIAAETQRTTGIKCECRTWEEAWALLLKAYGGMEQLEAALHERMLDKQDSTKRK